MRVFTYYHDEQKTIFDVLILFNQNRLTMFFHGTDRVIEYSEVNLEQTQYGTIIVYGNGSSLPWKDKNGVLLNSWVENKLDFIALDVESACTDHMICQLGICIVADKKIVGSKSWLIQPPTNKYDRQCVKVHHITAEMTQNSPTFDYVWPEIKEYLTDTSIVAHNAANFDEVALRKNLAYYHIDVEHLI